MSANSSYSHPTVSSGMKSTRRQLLQWAAGAAGAATATALLAACGGVGNTGSRGTSQLNVVTGSDPGVLDPHGTNAAVSEATIVFGQIFETLIDVSYPAGETLQLVPQLATEWKSVDDLTWEFKLRDGVKFHNGDKFTADDVKFSVERILDPAMKSPATQFLPPSLDHVAVVDPLTVRFITKTPFPLMLLDVSRVRIVPMKYVQAKGKDGFGKAPVGTGPFKYVEWVKDDHSTVEKNIEYWGGVPRVDRIVFKSMPEPGTRTAALKSGVADIITLVPISDIQSIKSTSNLDVAEVPSLRSMFIQLDSLATDSPLKDPKVRIALNYAIDKDALITHILDGHGVKLDGQLATKQYFGYNPNIQAYPYDVGKAKSLLAEAGYANGFDITLRGPIGRYVADKELVEAVGGQLQNVGVRAKVETTEWSVYIGNLYNRGLSPMFFLGWAPIPDALGMLTLEECASVVHYHCSKDYDAITAQAEQTVDASKRQQFYNQATQWLYDNPPVIYMHQQTNVYGINKKVAGFQPAPDEFMRLAKVSKT